MQIAVVDDLEPDRSELCGLLTRYFTQRCLQAELCTFSSAEALLAVPEPEQFSIIFLDIYMAHISGMEAARVLQEKAPSCRIIFCTTSHEHAVESYTVHAAYYLTKPLDYSRLCLALDASCAGLLEDSLYITVHLQNVEARVLLRDILFADCSRERTRLHLSDRLLLPDERVSDVLGALNSDGRFLQCNRNIVVNMNWVAKVLDGDFLLKNGETVPIRQRGRSIVKKDYLSYSLKSLRKGTRV